MQVRSLSLPAPQFAGLTYPRFRPLLTQALQGPSTQTPLVFGVHEGDLAVGLALCGGADPQGRRPLLSIQVNALYRRMGVGRDLLRASQDEGRARGDQAWVAMHSSRSPSAHAFERLLAADGWATPTEYEFRLAGRAAWAAQAARDWAPLLKRLLRGGFATLPWDQVGATERAAIARRVANDLSEHERAHHYDPAVAERSGVLEPRASLVLLRAGEVAGWIVGAREPGLGPAVFSFPRAWIVPALRAAGWWVGGIHAVCTQQAQHFGLDSLSIFEIAPKDTRLRRLVERQIAPYSAWTDVRWRSQKVLACDKVDP